MGSALSVRFAEIVMQRLENKIVKVFSEKICFGDVMWRSLNLSS